MHARAARPPIAPPRNPGKSSAKRREARERRRKEPSLAGYVATNFPAPEQLAPIPGDPLEHLEEYRLAYVAEIERCAMRCLIPADRAAIMLKLAKLTSLGRVGIDVHATLERLQPEPDLRQLTRDDLRRLLEDQSATEVVAEPALPKE